eukprot:gene25605-33434_t
MWKLASNLFFGFEPSGVSSVNLTAGNKITCTTTTTTKITGGNEKKENSSDENTILDRLDVFLTLPQKICKAFPDIAYAINSPNVILVGPQCAGKTKLMISLIFHHLVDKDFFTDEIGERLLKLFPTGSTMATRRPTTVHLSSQMDSDNCRVRLELGNQSAEFSNIDQFDALLDAMDAQSRAKNNSAFMEEVVISIYAKTLPNVSFTDLTGLRTIDQPLCDAETTTIKSLVCEYMRRPETIIFAVESASCQDYSTSHIVPLMKNIQETSRQDIFEHSVLVLSKCDMIVLNGKDEERILNLVNLTDPQLKEFPFKYVVGTINDIDCDSERKEDRSMAEFKARFCKVKAHERSVFAKFKSSETGMVLSQETQCTTTAVFNKMEDIPNSMLCVSMKRGLSIIEEKLEEQKALIMDTLAPPLSYYDLPLPGHSRLVFVSDLQNSVLLLANAAYTSIFNCKPYARVEDVSARFDVPIFILGDIGSHRLRSSFVRSLIAHVVKHLSTTFLLVYERMFARSECLCLSRNASALNRVDRFPRLCSFIQSHMQSQLPLCLQKAIASFEQTAAAHCGKTLEKILWDRSSDRNGAYLFMYDLLDSLMHGAAMNLSDEVTRVVSGLGELIVGEESLWEEAQDFHLERVRLESSFSRLQAQKLRLEACMARKDELDRSGDSEHSLRHAVDAAVAEASTSDSMPMMPVMIWEEISQIRMLHCCVQEGWTALADICLRDDVGLRERIANLRFIFTQEGEKEEDSEEKEGIDIDIGLGLRHDHDY